MVVKLLSQDPSYKDAPREAVRRVLEKLFGQEIKRSTKLSTRKIGAAVFCALMAS